MALPKQINKHEKTFRNPSKGLPKPSKQIQNSVRIESKSKLKFKSKQRRLGAKQNWLQVQIAQSYPKLPIRCLHM